jgi:hypothetical protein
VARGDPRATGQAKYEQTYGQNEHLARANKAPGGSNRSTAWPTGLPRQFDFPAGRVGGFGVHGSTGGATGAGFGLLYFESRFCARRALGFGSSSRTPCRYCFWNAVIRLQQTVEGEKDTRTFTQRLVNALLRVAQVVIALSLTPTP